MPLTLSDPIVRGPLALFPVLDDALPAPDYLTGPQAEAAGVLAVAELGDGATVPELAVHNGAEVPVLLVEGETIVGAKQHRTLNVTVLVPAAVTLPIPVSCVEAGRWGKPRAAKRSGRSTPPALRRLKTRSVNLPRAAGLPAFSNQGEVWDSVRAYNEAYDTSAPTDDFEAVHKRLHDAGQDLLDGVVPIDGQRGVLVEIAGEVCALDCFDKPETLATYWATLLSGYVVDAFADAPTEPDVAVARDFLNLVQSAERTVVDAIGSGQARVLVGAGITGHELHWGEAVVHLAAFPSDN
jgi:hypothetical protein